MQGNNNLFLNKKSGKSSSLKETAGMTCFIIIDSETDKPHTSQEQRKWVCPRPHLSPPLEMV